MGSGGKAEAKGGGVERESELSDFHISAGNARFHLKTTHTYTHSLPRCEAHLITAKPREIIRQICRQPMAISVGRMAQASFYISPHKGGPNIVY